MINFILCDDNIKVLDKFSKMLEAIFINHNIEANISFKATSPNSVLEHLESNETDVLILDINLKTNINGCDLANAIRKKNKKIYIIFITAHLEYALLAYKYKTFDFLPKPVTEEKLEETILRLLGDMNSSSPQFIKLNNGKTLVNPSKVKYIKKDGMKIIFSTNSCTYESYNSFNKIQNCLPDNFVRCHKSFIVNIDQITNVHLSKNKILLNHNEHCSIGAKYKRNFMEVFNNGTTKHTLDSINNGK